MRTPSAVRDNDLLEGARSSRLSCAAAVRCDASRYSHASLCLHRHAQSSLPSRNNENSWRSSASTLLPERDQNLLLPLYPPWITARDTFFCVAIATYLRRAQKYLPRSFERIYLPTTPPLPNPYLSFAEYYHTPHFYPYNATQTRTRTPWTSIQTPKPENMFY